MLAASMQFPVFRKSTYLDRCFYFFDTVAAAPQAKAMSRGEARQAATVVISYQELMLRTCFATTSQFAAPPHNMQLSDSQTTG